MIATITFIIRAEVRNMGRGRTNRREPWLYTATILRSRMAPTGTGANKNIKLSTAVYALRLRVGLRMLCAYI